MAKATLKSGGAIQIGSGFGYVNDFGNGDDLDYGFGGISGFGNGFGFGTGFGGFFGAHVTGSVQTGVANTQTVAASYSDEAISELLFMIEEEKLAGDVYEAFYDLYGLEIFNNIAESEDRHFDALINQAEQMGLDVDAFVFQPAGTFVDEELQALYDSMIETGSQSVTAALEVGVAIEEKDIVDIAAAAEAVEGTTLASVYDNLLTGSSYHLEAFESVLSA